MSYDLAVWEGPLPPSDEAAAEHFANLMDRMESEDLDVEPTPRIRAYVEALTARWPDIGDEGGEDSPWASGPLIGEAFGDTIYFPMVFSRAEEGSDFAARLAQEHGLVCYDPQGEVLRPTRPEPGRKSWFRRS